MRPGYKPSKSGSEMKVLQIFVICAGCAFAIFLVLFLAGYRFEGDPAPQRLQAQETVILPVPPHIPPNIGAPAWQMTSVKPHSKEEFLKAIGDYLTALRVGNGAILDEMDIAFEQRWGGEEYSVDLPMQVVSIDGRDLLRMRHTNFKNVEFHARLSDISASRLALLSAGDHVSARLTHSSPLKLWRIPPTPESLWCIITVSNVSALKQ